MTSSHSTGRSGLRSLVAVAAVGAVALSTYLAPVATAATTIDPDGTVTVTADPAHRRRPPRPPWPTHHGHERCRRRRDDRQRDDDRDDGDRPTTTATSDHDTTTPKPLGLLHRDARPPPGASSPPRSLEDPTSAKVEWAGVACATRYNVSVFVDGKDSVDVVPAPDDHLLALEPRPRRRPTASRSAAATMPARAPPARSSTCGPPRPAASSAMKVTYSDVKGAVLSWKAPVAALP